MNVNTSIIREKANFIAKKVDDGIYKIKKDRNGHYSGQVYINTQQLIDVLNQELNLIIYDKDESVIEHSFNFITTQQLLNDEKTMEIFVKGLVKRLKEIV